jgi:hypothetical protein
MIYAFIKKKGNEHFPIERCVKYYQVGQRSYYRWESVSFRQKTKTELVKEKITILIQNKDMEVRMMA